MHGWWELLTFWNIMGGLGVMVTALMTACAAFGAVQGLVESWRETFPDGFRWPWQMPPKGGEKPRIYRVQSLDDQGLDG